MNRLGPSVPAANSQRLKAVCGAVLLGFVARGRAGSLTRSPWWDEGMLADPAHQLAAHGRLGSAILSEYGHPIIRDFPGYARYTYWTLPEYVVVLAGWSKVFGFSPFAGRMLSLLCGLGLIFGCRVIASRLSGSAGLGMLAAALVATDYTVLLSCVTVRMDAMAAALGYGAIAAYLALRERGQLKAVIVASALAAASAFAHPVAILYTGGLLMTAVYFDRVHLRPKHFLFAALPYLVCAGLWGIYIARAPAIFWRQISLHAAYRVGGLASPLQSVLWDWRYRYLTFFFPSGGGAERLKVFVLAAYAAGFVAALAVPVIRRSRGVVYLLLLLPLYYVELAVLDHAQFPHYMVHVVVAAELLLALVIGACWRQRLIPRIPLAAAAAAFMALQLGGHLIRIRSNSYATAYLPTIKFLQAHATPSTLIMGPTQLLFSLGERYRLVDDARLGGLSGQRAQIIVLDSFHPGASSFTGREPDMARWVDGVLTKRFHLAATYGEFRIYLPNEPAPAARTGKHAQTTSSVRPRQQHRDRRE